MSPSESNNENLTAEEKILTAEEKILMLEAAIKEREESIKIFSAKLSEAEIEIHKQKGQIKRLRYKDKKKYHQIKSLESQISHLNTQAKADKAEIEMLKKISVEPQAKEEPTLEMYRRQVGKLVKKRKKYSEKIISLTGRINDLKIVGQDHDNLIKAHLKVRAEYDAGMNQKGRITLYRLFGDFEINQ